MIDSKDLRKHNILLDENNKLIQVETIHSDGINYMDGHIYGTKFKDLTPTKLTPEILEQIGFKIKYDKYYGIECNSIYFEAYDFLDVGTGIQVFDDNGCKVVLLEYLHDLQNFYYQFNKQELPIDINTLKI